MRLVALIHRHRRVLLLMAGAFLVVVAVGVVLHPASALHYKVTDGGGGGSGAGGGGGGGSINPCDPNAPTDQCTTYKVDQPLWKWDQPFAEAGIPYTIDIEFVPEGITVEIFKQMVDAAFQTWDSNSRVHFVRDPSQVYLNEAGVCSGCGRQNSTDGINTIYFQETTNSGFTDTGCFLNGSLCIVYKDTAPNDVNRDVKHIKGVDTYIDLYPSKPWADGAVAGKNDLQSTITHEIGHWLYLNDLYDAGTAKLTMYGNTVENSIEKRTLGTSDKKGLNYIYDGGPQ